MQLLTMNTFQIVEFEFTPDINLDIYLNKVKIDSKFPKKGNNLDNFKKVMLDEIIRNTGLKVQAEREIE